MANFKYSQQKRFIKNVTPDIEEELGGDSKVYYNHRIDLTMLDNRTSLEVYYTFIIVTSDSTPFTEETFKTLFDYNAGCAKLFQCFMTMNGTIGNLKYLSAMDIWAFVTDGNLSNSNLSFVSLIDTVTTV